MKSFEENIESIKLGNKSICKNIKLLKKAANELKVLSDFIAQENASLGIRPLRVMPGVRRLSE